MATGSSREASPSSGLGEDDLGKIYNALYRVRTSYKPIGLQIGVKISEIESVESKHTDPGDRLLGILSIRVKKEDVFTWRDIQKALRSDCVGEGKVADEIQKKYVNPPVKQHEKQPQSDQTKKRKQKAICIEGGPPLHPDKVSDNHGEGSGRVKRKMHSEKREKVSEKPGRNSAHGADKQVELVKEKKGNVQRDESYTHFESERKMERKLRRKKKPAHEKEKSIRVTESADQDSQRNPNQKYKHKPKKELEIESDDEYFTASSETESESAEFHRETRKREASARYVEEKPESPPCKGATTKGRKKEKNSAATAASEQLESEDELSSASSSEEEISEVSQTPEPTRKTMPKVKRTPKSGRNAEELEIRIKKREVGERANQKAKQLAYSGKEKCPKTGSKPIEKKRESEIHSETKAVTIPLDTGAGDSTHEEDSEDEESDLDGRSEDEEARDSEQKSSNEGNEETEHDDESSAAASEEEGKKIAVRSERREEERKEELSTTKRMMENASASPSRYDPRGGTQGVKKRKRKHKESSMSQLARGSASLSASPEETPKTPGSRRQRKKTSSGSRDERKEKRKRRGEGLISFSETDDSSSPECDMSRNLTEIEAKNILKVFKRFFGKLCCAILNPVEIAAQLQEKHLISQDTMIDMLRSPESQQDKTIGLVSKLSKRIDSRPYRLYRFLEVLLGNDSLKGAGREILIETGKVCPERTAARFPSQLPSAESSVFSLKGNGGDVKETTAENISQPATTPVSGDISRSVPQPAGLSPVLAKYKQYLQACYNARTLAPADKYLPTLEAPYINLAMIRRGRYDPGERDEFTRRTLHGGVDQILESKTPIKIEDLLAFESTEEPYQVRAEEGVMPFMALEDSEYLLPSEYSRIQSSSRGASEDKKRLGRFILVEGPPGIGKSTFAWEACREWDEIESLRDYHTVVLLRLREKWVLNATSLSDLLRYPSHPDFSESIASELVELQGRNLLLVLDGFDEVSHSFHEDSVIKSILCRQLLPECTIVLTTRPVAKSTLESICQPRVDKHVEIIGFTEGERVRYVTEVFSKEPELQVNFLKYMFLVPHIKSMMYIPLNCAIIAQVYYESQSSRHLAIPRTRTQLYKALTHSLLVRHMKMKESNFECSSMLPEGLKKEDYKKFMALTKFAFDSYHKGESRKVTFFKEDIPEGLVHFGFMNESTEMYAGKGVERTLSFLHLSLQEYLAAWHLATGYSIEFQVAYHRLAVDVVSSSTNVVNSSPFDIVSSYKGDIEDERALMLSLAPIVKSLVEPAIFLAGITGWRCQSEDDRNHWETYLSHDNIIDVDSDLLVQSLYEAQNPTMVSHYFAAEGAGSSRRNLSIAENLTPYSCYALSYCVAHSSVPLNLSVYFENDADTSHLETFVRGLIDHCSYKIPRVQHLTINVLIETLDKNMFWIMKAPFLSEVKELKINNPGFSHFPIDFLHSFNKLQSIQVDTYYSSSLSWEWLTALKSLNELKSLHIQSIVECSIPPTDLCWPLEHGLTELVLDIILPYNTTYDLRTAVDVMCGSVLKSVLRSDHITKLVLPNVSRETMGGVHSILLHCPSLTTLELKRTRLGYDGILYICSALRNNTALKSLVIHDFDELEIRSSRMFSSMESFPLPTKTTCTDFLLELNDILRKNATLEDMKIQSGLFLPLYPGGDREYSGVDAEWTGLGPLQQFNVGAVRSCMSPNLRRSFSSSDLTQPQTQLFWKVCYYTYTVRSHSIPGVNFNKLFSEFTEWNKEVNFNSFNSLFSKRKEEGKKLFSLPSFTAPDTEVLQSFSGLDPRLKACLEISHLHQYVATIRETYCNVMEDCRRELFDII